MASWPSVRAKGVGSQSLQVADQTAVGCDDGNPAPSQQDVPIKFGLGRS